MPTTSSPSSAPSYPPSLVPGALLTDLYQLTMAYGLWRAGRAAHDGAFHLYVRTPPFGGGYSVACGVEAAAAYLERLRFADDDLAYVASLRGARRGRTAASPRAARHPAVRRLVNPHAYPAGLELALHERKTAMILRANGLTDA